VYTTRARQLAVACESMPSPETLVIGAGLAGLTAAVHLAARGAAVRVLEADALYPGGRLWGGPLRPHASLPGEAGEGGEAYNAVAVTLNGVTRTFYSEHGIHGLWNNYSNLRATLERFGIAPEVMLTEEEEWIHGEGERVRRAEVGSAIHSARLPPPLHYLEMFTRPSFLGLLGLRDWLSLFAVWRSLLLAAALDPFARSLPLEGQTLADFLRGWSPRLQALFVGLARSGLASPPEKISLASFIACLRFYTLLRRDSLRFTYFQTDSGTALIEPLVEALCAREGELLLGVTADRLEQMESDGWQVTGDAPPDTRRSTRDTRWRVRAQTRLGPRTFLADHVILAVDAPAAQRILCESPATRAEAGKLTWPEGLPDGIVRLWFDARPRPGPEGGIFTGDFIVDNFFWLHRIQPEFAEWAKATGGSAIEMHLYRSDEFLSQPDAVLLARSITDVYRAYPELRGRVIRQTLQRNAATHTRLTIDRPERWLGVRTPWPNLWACGDWVRGPWPSLFIERACVSGVEAANAALDGMGLEPFPIAPYPEPEWLAAKIQNWLLGGRAFIRSIR